MGDFDYTDKEAEEAKKDREQLSALRTATCNSKGSYDSDITSLSNAISLIDSESPIVSAMTDFLSGLLGDVTFDSNYDTAISRINNCL